MSSENGHINGRPPVAANTEELVSLLVESANLIKQGRRDHATLHRTLDLFLQYMEHPTNSHSSSVQKPTTEGFLGRVMNFANGEEPPKTMEQKAETSRKNAERARKELQQGNHNDGGGDDTKKSIFSFPVIPGFTDDPASMERSSHNKTTTTTTTMTTTTPAPVKEEKPYSSSGSHRAEFQRPANPKTALIANGWIEQQRRSRMRTVWKEVLASLVEGRKSGEETTLWIQRQIVNPSTNQTELEALHQIPVKWLEDVTYFDYSVDNRFSIKVFNLQEEFIFRCPKDPSAAKNWVDMLVAVRDKIRQKHKERPSRTKPASSPPEISPTPTAAAAAAATVSPTPEQSPLDRKTRFGIPTKTRSWNDKQFVPFDEPDEVKKNSAAAAASQSNHETKTPTQPPPKKKRTITELRAIAHGAGIQTVGMERGELEEVVAKIEAANTAATAPPPPPPPQQQQQQPQPQPQPNHDEELKRRRQREEQERQRAERERVEHERRIKDEQEQRAAEEARRRAEEKAEQDRVEAERRRQEGGQEELRQRIAERVHQQQAVERRKQEEEECARLEKERLAREEAEHQRRVAEMHERNRQEQLRKQQEEQERQRQEQIRRQQEEYARQQRVWQEEQARLAEAARLQREREAYEARQREEEARRRQQAEHWAAHSAAQQQQQQQAYQQWHAQQQAQTQQQQQQQYPFHQQPQQRPGFPYQQPQQRPGFPYQQPPQAQTPPPQQHYYQQQQQQQHHQAPPPPPPQSPVNQKYANMAKDNDVAATNHQIRHGVLVHWALQPPMFQTLKPIEALITTIHAAFPPSFGVTPHDHFQKWKVVPMDEILTNHHVDTDKVTKAVRKLRLVLHPDRLPKDLSADQLFLTRLLWDIISDAFDEHKKKEEDLGWIKG